MSNAVSGAASVDIADFFRKAGFDLPAVRDEFEHGAGPAFAVLSIRGGKFRVRQGGEETLVKNADGDPVSAIKAVIVRANPHFSKTYYKKGYEEGDDDSPTCYSMDGVRPEADVEERQNDVCATCKWNARGSRVTETGQKLKACADVRRVAVVPHPDMKNESFGGPMLLRVPAASLKPLAEYSRKLSKLGWPVYALVTKIAMDPEPSYPRMLFSPTQPLTDEEAAAVMELREDERTHAILQTISELQAGGSDIEGMEALAGKEPPAATKAEPKKAEPKKAEAKKAEANEAEPNEAEPKKAEPEKAAEQRLDDLKGDQTPDEPDEPDEPEGSQMPPVADTEEALDALLGGL